MGYGKIYEFDLIQGKLYKKLDLGIHILWCKNTSRKLN